MESLLLLALGVYLSDSVSCHLLHRFSITRGLLAHQLPSICQCFDGVCLWWEAQQGSNNYWCVPKVGAFLFALVASSKVAEARLKREKVFAVYFGNNNKNPCRAWLPSVLIFSSLLHVSNGLLSKEVKMFKHYMYMPCEESGWFDF